LRAVGAPRPVAVRADRAGVPRAVRGRPVEAVRDDWRVDEGWWTSSRVRRRYFDVLLAGGRAEVVFRDEASGRWYAQRA
jgi:hypothetical protein